MRNIIESLEGRLLYAVTPVAESKVAAMSAYGFVASKPLTKSSPKLASAQATVNLSGLVFTDANGSGTKQNGEAVRSGVVVYLDLNGNGKADSGEPTSTSDVSGAYSFSGVTPGTYKVRASVTGNLVQSTPSTITLVSGQNVTNFAVGVFDTSATISGTVYNDVNGDGKFSGETNAGAGVTVYIDTNANGKLDTGEAKVVTDSTGAYTFTGVAPGTYVVRLDVTGLKVQSNDVNVVVENAVNKTGVDIGVFDRTGGITGTVYDDTDGDGTQDNSETNTLSGLTVYLDANNNAKLDKGEVSTTTDVSGAYAFTGVAPGAYVVRVVTAGNNYQSTDGSVTVVDGLVSSGTDVGVSDAGASVSGVVFNDPNNNGVKDGGDAVVPNVVVYLDANNNGKLDKDETKVTTDSSGAYSFTGLAPGAYNIRIDTTGQLAAQSTDNPLTLETAQQKTSFNLGRFSKAVTISGKVFNDDDGDGTKGVSETYTGAGVTVFLDANGNGKLEKTEVSTTTDASGAYTFTNLAAGTYVVRVPVTGNHVVSTDSTVTLADGQAIGNVDVGDYNKAITITGFVFTDKDGDGSFDNTESAVAAGTVVYLDTNNNGKQDKTEASTTTDANGAYSFTDLPTGTYVVRAVSSGLLKQSTDTKFTASAAQTKLVNIGIFDTSVTVQGKVYNDVDGDGTKGVSETYAGSNVVVYLDANNNGKLDKTEASTKTDANGAYSFTGVAPGSYVVRVQADGLLSNTAVGSFTATGGETKSYDLGLFDRGASISGTVYYDLDGDGAKGNGETNVLAGATVYLDANGNGKLDATETKTTTDSSGAYAFSGIKPGTYKVVVDLAKDSLYRISSANSATLGDHDIVTNYAVGVLDASADISGVVYDDVNGNATKDNTETNVLSGVTVYLDSNSNGKLDSTEKKTTTDASGAYTFLRVAPGKYAVRVVNTGNRVQSNAKGTVIQAAENMAYNVNPASFDTSASIAGTIFTDTNINGTQDNGESAVAAGVTVFLDTNSNGKLEATEKKTTTDASGAYSFTGLAPGKYNVRVSVADQVIQTKNGIFQLANAQNKTGWDLGIFNKAVSISGNVFVDSDGSGTKGNGESAAASGVVVFLDSNNNGKLDTGESKATTDATGGYSFTGLKPGAYNVKLNLDGNKVTTAGGKITLTPGQTKTGFDVGIYDRSASISGTVFNDQDGSGTQDNPDTNVTTGVTVFLDGNNNGKLDAGEKSTKADANGSFSFTGLAPGRYNVRLSTTGRVTQSTNGAVTLTPTQTKTGFLVGYFDRSTQIAGTVFYDTDGSGDKNGNESNVAAGVVVYVDTNDNGKLDAGEPSTKTDGNGAYTINNLAPGRYTLGVTVSGNSVQTTFPAIVLIGGQKVSGVALGVFDTSATLRGKVYNDADNSGSLSNSETNALSGITVYLDKNNNGKFDAGEPTFKTGADGTFSFTGIAPGTYAVLAKDLPTRVAQTTTVSNTYTLGNAEVNTNAAVGIFDSNIKISGTVYNDANANGSQDNGETAYTAAKVTLYLDSNANGTKDTGEPTTTTDANGAYTFTNLAAGSYSVRVVLPTGFKQTDPASNGAVSVSNVAAGATSSGNKVGIVENTGSIAGTVFVDKNGNGTKDAGETNGASGRVVYIDANNNGSQDGGETAVTTTSTGAYTIPGLVAGSYKLRLVPLSGTTQTLPSGSAAATVTVTNKTATTQNFGVSNTAGGSIRLAAAVTPSTVSPDSIGGYKLSSAVRDFLSVVPIQA